MSWYETPGLSSLEAAASGCAIVSTEVGTAYEYFGDYAEYCDPKDINSIKSAIERAWEKGPLELLKEKIIEYYNWERAAMLTLDAYIDLLERK